jgi:hypothetical protein
MTMTDNDTTRVESLRDLIGQYDRNVAQNAATERRHLEGHDRGTEGRICRGTIRHK